MVPVPFPIVNTEIPIDVRVRPDPLTLRGTPAQGKLWRRNAAINAAGSAIAVASAAAAAAIANVVPAARQAGAFCCSRRSVRFLVRDSSSSRAHRVRHHLLRRREQRLHVLKSPKLARPCGGLLLAPLPDCYLLLRPDDVAGDGRHKQNIPSPRRAVAVGPVVSAARSNLGLTRNLPLATVSRPKCTIDAAAQYPLPRRTRRAATSRSPIARPAAASATASAATAAAGPRHVRVRCQPARRTQGLFHLHRRRRRCRPQGKSGTRCDPSIYLVIGRNGSGSHDASSHQRAGSGESHWSRRRRHLRKFWGSSDGSPGCGGSSPPIVCRHLGRCRRCRVSPHPRHVRPSRRNCQCRSRAVQ